MSPGNIAVYDSSDTAMLPGLIQVTAPGPVSVLLKLEKSQSYKLQVTTPVTQNVSGSYQVLFKPRPTVSLAEESRIEAQNFIIAARNVTALSDQVEKYQHALLQARNAADVNLQAQIFLMLGNAYRNARDTKLADENYKRALSLWKQNNDKRGEAYANIRLGSLYLNLQPDSAIPFYTEAALLLAQAGDRRGRGEALYGQGFAML